MSPLLDSRFPSITPPCSTLCHPPNLPDQTIPLCLLNLTRRDHWGRNLIGIGIPFRWAINVGFDNDLAHVHPLAQENQATEPPARFASFGVIVLNRVTEGDGRHIALILDTRTKKATLLPRPFSSVAPDSPMIVVTR